MRSVLLDEGVPRQMAAPLRDAGLDVLTVEQAGMKGLDNGRLLRAAEGRFDVLLTADQNIYAQQNLAGRLVTIVVVPTNRKAVLIARAADILAVVIAAGSGQYVQISRDGSVTTRLNDEPSVPGTVASLSPFDLRRR